MRKNGTCIHFISLPQDTPVHNTTNFTDVNIPLLILYLNNNIRYKHLIYLRTAYFSPKPRNSWLFLANMRRIGTFFQATPTNSWPRYWNLCEGEESVFSLPLSLIYVDKGVSDPDFDISIDFTDRCYAPSTGAVHELDSW